jgi:catechol 2,3-dioxygenase-like lactoylglutathione lyase family enzyme
MIGYITIGTSDLDKALAFYDDLLSGLGGKRVMETGNGYLYGFAKGALLGVTRPYDGQTQQCGNGNMVALSAGTRDQVNALHARALALGGKDEGAPGVRVGSFYGAYFRDLDGNKVCFYCMGE